MQRRVAASREFTGPWWVAVALLGIEPEELVTPVLEELHAHVSRATSVSRIVDVECGPLERETDHATMAVHWRDASHAWAFPEMRGQIQLFEIGGNKTELRFVGTYDPPFGTLGRIGDAVAGRRVAQRTVDEVVERLAERLEAAVSLHIETRDRAARRDDEGRSEC